MGDADDNGGIGCYLNPTFLSRISPGQIPVMPAKARNTTGMYRNQWTRENPVSHIPIRMTSEVDMNKAR